MIAAFPEHLRHAHQDIPRVPTPVGQRCQACEAPIASYDRGFVLPCEEDGLLARRPWHRACFLRNLGIGP